MTQRCYDTQPNLRMLHNVWYIATVTISVTYVFQLVKNVIFILPLVSQMSHRRSGERRDDFSTARSAPFSLVVVGPSLGWSESGRQTGPASGVDQLPAPSVQLPGTLPLLHTWASGQGRSH